MNCLETALEAYKNNLDPEEITQVYKELTKRYNMLENKKANTVHELNKFAEELASDNEFDTKKSLLRQLNTMQSIVDSLQREQLFRQAGHKPKNSVARSMQSKMAGTSWKVERNKDNTYNRQGAATDAFYREFAKDIQGPLTPLFLSKTGQVELANALYEHRAGKPSDTPYGKLAEIITKYQDRFYEKLKPLGIYITERDDRIAPNVHNATRMTKLSLAEKKLAKKLYPEAGDPEYEYALQRWSDYILPRIDQEKVFVSRNVDPNNAAQVEEFQRKAFDNLVNQGKTSQKNVNYGLKFEQERVYHWKDGKSLIEYNDTFGNDSLQDSLTRELAHGFGMIEVMNDWGTRPDATIDRVLNAVDKNPLVVQRTGKAKEAKKLHDIMSSMTNREYGDQNALSSINTGLLTFESVTKLGLALASSIGDLRNTAYVVRKLGRNRFQAYGGVLKNMVAGMSKKDKENLYQFVNNGISNKLGQVNRFYVNPYSPTSWQGQAAHWAYKVNGLARWDNANKGYVASVVAQHLAEHRHIGWDALTDSDREIFGQYNITSEDWEMIRNSSTKISKSGEFITPDTIQDLPDHILISSLKRQGVKNPSAVRVQLYKDSVERKMTTFFRDRQEHAITSPDVVDKNMLTFGVTPDRTVFYNAIRIALQFKHFGIALFRKSVLPVLRENGATNAAEMFFGGKSNWKGIGTMGVELMALGYVSLTLKNLALGLSPPDLTKTDTWGRMLQSTLGPLSLAFNINLRDLKGSLGSFVEGPVGSDIEKLARLWTSAYQEAGQSRMPKTRKNAYQFVKNGIPFNAIMTKNLVNHFFLNEFEDWAYPGKREKDLRQIKKDTGATKLW